MTTFEKIITVIKWALGSILYYPSFFIPKKKNLWVFGSWFGEKYADNSKYLFEYVSRYHPEIKAVWLSVCAQTIKLIRNKGFMALKTFSAKGIWYSMRAKVGIISYGTDDINMFTLGNTQLVQLWHGTPLKKIGYDDKKTLTSQSCFTRLALKMFPFRSNVLASSLFSASSTEVQRVFAGAFRIKKERIKVTGYPRNDVFFMDQIEDFPIKNKLSKLRKNNKIGIYMPTHRKSGKADIFSLLADNIEQFNLQLSKINVVMLIKLHYHHLKSLNNHNYNYSNIIFLSEDDINQDVYPILTLVDFLITDYSSIYFDFLLADKPIIFAPFDIDQYSTVERELYYVYDDITPGPKAKTWDELFNCIRDTIKYPDSYHQKRYEIRKYFNEHIDGNNCRRVFDEIIKLI